MRGTEKILASIRTDAQSRADAILAEAQEQAAQIRAAYDKQAAEVYAEKLRAGTKLCQDALDSERRIAQMEAKKGVLAVKQEMVEESFALAAKELTRLPEAQYVDFLARLAVQAAVTGTEEIVLNARDRKAVGAAVVKAANARRPGSRFTLSERTGSFDGGLILSRGSIEANCTLELLVDLVRGDMAVEIADTLFA